MLTFTSRTFAKKLTQRIMEKTEQNRKEKRKGKEWKERKKRENKKRNFNDYIWKYQEIQ